MYIEPNTNIKLLRNCRLDNTYTHTIYFETVSEQTNYFSSLAKYSLNSFTYQRVNKNTMRVQYKAEDLYDCNYMMFQNASFGNKWFYAFIKSISYINNITSEIEYEIDVMQTWWFETELEQCFVEREHSITDNIGDNIVPENIGYGEYVYSTVLDDYMPFKGGEYSIVILRAVVDDTEPRPILNNVFSGCKAYTFVNPVEAYNYLKDLTNANKAEEVVAVYQVPSPLLKEWTNLDFSSEQPYDGNSKRVGQNIPSVDSPFSDYPDNPSSEKYTPKNNKLYTSPYVGIVVRSSNGDVGEYAYEYFDSGTPLFRLGYNAGPTPQAYLAPLSYKGVYNNYEEEIVCNDFPMCAYATDSFRAYIAQNAGRMGINLIARGGTAAIGAAITGAAASGIGLPVAAVATGAAVLSGVLSLLGDLSYAKALPNAKHGQLSQYVNYTRNSVGFRCYRYSIRIEFAKMIDDFFTMYGYATKRLKIPNRKARTHWTYTKTVGCDVHGSFPADDKEKICSIYDNGITFWVNGNEIGDYTLDNKVVS